MDSTTEVLRSMHGALLEALRHREQEIFSYLAILVPALGGFVWLLLNDVNRETPFLAGTFGVLLMLLLGAAYSLTLGYNYRYITLQLAKIEHLLSAKDAMLHGWPKSPEEFLKRYRIWHLIPCCTPPEMIKVFWGAFLIGILWVSITAYLSMTSGNPHRSIVEVVGGACFLAAFLGPVWFGYKLDRLCRKESKPWSRLRADNG